MLRLLFSLVRNVRFFERVLLIFLSFSLSACCLFFVGLIRSLHHLDHMSQIPRFALWWCSSHCLFLCTCLCYMKRKTNKYSKRQSKSWRGPLSRVDFLPPGKSIGNGQRRRENEERVPPSKETKVNTTFTSNLRENYNDEFWLFLFFCKSFTFCSVHCKFILTRKPNYWKNGLGADL